MSPCFVHGKSILPLQDQLSRTHFTERKTGAQRPERPGRHAGCDLDPDHVCSGSTASLLGLGLLDKGWGRVGTAHLAGWLQSRPKMTSWFWVLGGMAAGVSCACSVKMGSRTSAQIVPQPSLSCPSDPRDRVGTRTVTAAVRHPHSTVLVAPGSSVWPGPGPQQALCHFLVTKHLITQGGYRGGE
jgi:hypothetical protein